jgi:SpoVK/Ycf46/Vps4 family AAA+-type ATPase
MTIELYPRAEVEACISNEQISTLYTEPANHYETLRRMAQLTGQVLDSIAALHSSRPAHLAQSTITLAAPSNAHIPLAAIESSIPEEERSTRPETSFDMLGGLEQPKRALKLIANIFLDPEGSKQYGLTPSHFLLHGPAGTGKTSLVEAFGDYINAPVWNITSADIMDQYVGGSGKKLTERFEEAFKYGDRLVFFLDEIDSIAGTPGADSKSNIEVRNLLKQYLTKTSNEHPNVIVAAATNRDIDDIDPAIVRSGRFESISVPLPTEAERTDIWANILWREIAKTAVETDVVIGNNPNKPTISESGTKTHSLFDSHVNPLELATHTEGMTGADFEQILLLARRHCYAKYRETNEHQTVSQRLLLDIIATFHRR